ncbi:ATP-dependent DNA helicase PIF1-like protein [Tanacetum coccineum]
MDGYNRLIYDETSYNKDEQRDQHVGLYGCLTSKQKCIYSTVMDTVKKNKGGMYFVYGYGGNGKTYLYKNMSGALRSKGETLLNVASSGIATLFLKGGRTTHSRFAIPINVVEDSMCHIAADNDLDDLIRKAKLIEWDEAPMINRPCEIFAGQTRCYLLLRQDVHVTINASYLCEHCTVLKLTLNMRLGSGSTKSEKKIQEFSDWILDIGNGKLVGENDNESTVVFLYNMLISETDDVVGSIIDETYPELL